MNKQLDLFILENDDRVENLKFFIKRQLMYYPYWHPSAKDIVELSNRFKVTGNKPLELYMEIIEARTNK